MNTGMTGLNGATRPHLYTADTRLGDAIDIARRAYPHQERKFVTHIAVHGCVPIDTALTHWMLWRHEYLARPLGERLAESIG